MNVAEKINRYVQRLPGPAQAEVLDFVEFMAHKLERVYADQERREWATGSLASAMRGIRQEEEPVYSESDIKESFS